MRLDGPPCYRPAHSPASHIRLLGMNERPDVTDLNAPVGEVAEDAILTLGARLSGIGGELNDVVVVACAGETGRKGGCGGQTWSLSNSCWRASFPALLAITMVRK
jgi:hypothetical protein